MEWEEKMLIPGFNVLLPLVERFRGKYKGDRGIEGGAFVVPYGKAV